MARNAFNKSTKRTADSLAEIIHGNFPITLRGAFYRAVSAGVYPDTSDHHYRQCGRLVLKLRQTGAVPYHMIVDSTRRREKPSSWSGLVDYADTVARCYRLDLWQRQKDYIEIFVEKDAMAAVILPVSEEYDVHLNVIRGCVSESFVWSVAEAWKGIEKPIFGYYLGDHDPSGLMIERDLRQRLSDFVGRDFEWKRLAISPADFGNEELLGFPIKGTRTSKAWRTKHKEYLSTWGDRCVEVDALAPIDIRDRIRTAIEGHIDQSEWARLREIEAQERETVKLVLAKELEGAA